jgi:hypothetical protein
MVYRKWNALTLNVFFFWNVKKFVTDVKPHTLKNIVNNTETVNITYFLLKRIVFLYYLSLYTEQLVFSWQTEKQNCVEF